MKKEERIMLLVTENCNLNCIYCYEHQKNSKKMSFETAKQILDNRLKGADPETIFVIELFGGEAFANFPLIKQIDEYLKENYGHLFIVYETTTNGTLVHGEVQEWLLAHQDQFYMALSLDGTKEMHDQNRMFVGGGGSFDSIDLEFFANTWKKCPAKMTVSEKTLPHFAEGVAYLDSLGFTCDATLSIGVEWDQEKNTPILLEELEKLVTYYTEHSDRELCTLLNHDLRKIFAKTDDNYRFCGANLCMKCYDTEGNAYPCQGFAPVSIGEQAKTFKDFDDTKFVLPEENECKSCPWIRLCANCYAANLQSTGDIHKTDPNLCKFYKMCILASAKIQYRRLLEKETLTKEDQLVLKAISIIQETMEC